MANAKSCHILFKTYALAGEKLGYINVYDSESSVYSPFDVVI